MINCAIGNDFAITEELEVKPEVGIEVTNFSSQFSFTDLGEFIADKIADLRPGEYFVAVLPAEMHEKIVGDLEI